jgi:hypothetical protein
MLALLFFGGMAFFIIFLVVGFCLGGESELKTSEMSGFVLDPNSVDRPKKVNKDEFNIEEV